MNFLIDNVLKSSTNGLHRIYCKLKIENWKLSFWLVGLVALATFLRLYNAIPWFMYSHDQDLLGWVIRDIVENGHLRLIGQETSQQGVFIGPLFYYTAIPFYLLFNWNPVGGIALVTLIGITTTLSYWYVLNKVFNKLTAIIGTLIYAASYAIVLTDREVVPTTPVSLWSIWYFYALYLLLKGKQQAGWPLIGLLAGLVWHLNMGLVLLLPLSLVSFALSRRKINFKSLLVGVVVAIMFMLPFFVFETRHNFSQTRAILTSLSTESAGQPALSNKFDRVMQLASKNIHRLIFPDTVGIRHLYTFLAVIAVFGFLTVRKALNRNLAAVMAIWLVTFLLFFTINSINISEYYLNGMTTVWIAILATFLSWLYAHGGRWLVILLLGVWVAGSIYSFSNHAVNESGYIHRRSIVKEIKQDAIAKGYPCVAVSYITKPGFDLGYRYLFWLEDMHVNNPVSGSPVYTIVFPHSMVDRIDKSFGALGLIYPEYTRYNTDLVNESCSGQNSNVTDPLFGYTE